MTSPKLIRDKIIELIDNFDYAAYDFPDYLAKAKIFKGEPPRSRWPAFPWGWVEWAAGRMEAPVGVKAEIHDEFYIVVVDKHIHADKAEDSIMDFAEAVESALDENPSLDGLVAASYVINREKQKLFEGDYSIVATRITLSTRRRE